MNKKNAAEVSTKDVFCKALIRRISTGVILNTNTEVYGSWADVYWAEKLGGRFQKDYRASISKDGFILVDSSDKCLVIELNTGETSQCIQHNLKQLFHGKTGKTVEADDKALKELQKLGYIGQDE